MKDIVIIRGKIEKIEYKNDGGHPKKVATVVQKNDKTAFVEFRGRKMDLLNTVEENDHIKVGVSVEGKKSNSGEALFNNLVAHYTL